MRACLWYICERAQGHVQPLWVILETSAHWLPLPWKYNICSNHTAPTMNEAVCLFTCCFHIYCKWEERHKEMNGPEQPLAMNMKLFLLSAIWRHLLRWLFPSWLDQNWLICGRPLPHWSLLLESSWPNLSSLWSSVRPTPTPYYIIYERLIIENEKLYQSDNSECSNWSRFCPRATLEKVNLDQGIAEHQRL